MAMTYKDSLRNSDKRLGSALATANELDQSLTPSFMENQSPIMKMWFVVMVLNLALFLFLLH